MDHSVIDERSLALHKAVADKLRIHPALMDVARSNLNRWLESMEVIPPALREWQEVLAHKSVDEILALIVDPGEEPTRLRQSSPFGGVLSEDERMRIFRRYESLAA